MAAHYLNEFTGLRVCPVLRLAEYWNTGGLSCRASFNLPLPLLFLLVGEEGGVVGMVKHPLVNDLRCPF